GYWSVYEEIIVNFMLPGHTKFICDSFFGQIKKVYRDNRANIIDDVENIVNSSSKGNDAIQYKNGKGLDIGKVYASKKSNDDRKKYLYSRIRQHVDDPYKDILCSQP
ncbi:4573_t:CDS:2, partial [Ambispora leptoticha]